MTVMNESGCEKQEKQDRTDWKSGRQDGEHSNRRRKLRERTKGAIMSRYLLSIFYSFLTSGTRKTTMVLSVTSQRHGASALCKKLKM